MNKNKGSASDYRRQDGFTLIELLVVIAIIGILSSVVLASLTSARQKGKVAAIQSTMSSMRAAAEIGMINGKYVANVCGKTSAEGGMLTLLTSIRLPAARATAIKCGVDAADATKQPFKWAVEAGLPDTSATPTVSGIPTWFCVDSTGYSGVIATSKIKDGYGHGLDGGASCK